MYVKYLDLLEAKAIANKYIEYKGDTQKFEVMKDMSGTMISIFVVDGDERNLLHENLSHEQAYLYFEGFNTAFMNYLEIKKPLTYS